MLSCLVIFTESGLKIRHQRHVWSEESLALAAQAVQSGGISMRTASAHFGIPRTTLGRYLDTGKVSNRLGKRPTFTDGQERMLVIRLQEHLEKGISLDSKIVRQEAFRLADELDIPAPFDKKKQIAGISWCRNFLSRHPALINDLTG